MTAFGYTMMCEQSPPDQLVSDVRIADLMVAVEPEKELGEMFDAAGGAGKPRVGQIAVCYDTDRDRAIARAYDQFRWFGLGRSRRRCPAVPMSTSTSRRSSRSSTQASTRWRSSRSAPTTRS